MGRLDNKVAVITGAASGMGRATAIRFAGEGAAVVVADLNEEGGAATVRDCKENGGRAVFQKIDVSLEADIKALIAGRSVSSAGSTSRLTMRGLSALSDRWKRLRPQAGIRPMRSYCVESSSASSIQFPRCAKWAGDRLFQPLQLRVCAAGSAPPSTAPPKPG